MKRYAIINIFFILIHSVCFSQDINADSLLNTAKNDRDKISVLNRLFLEYEFSDPEKAGTYLNEAFELSQKTNNKKALVLTYYHLGFFAEDKGNYPEALKNYYASLKLAESIADKAAAADASFGIGNIYYLQENYEEALKKFTASLKIYEALGKKQSIATAYNNIGGVYFHQRNYPEALKKYKEGLKIREALGDQRAIADSYGSIGNVYSDQGNYKEALEKYFAALEIMEKTGSRFSAAGVCSNIGIVYTKQKKHEEARRYLNKARDLSIQIGFLECLQNTYSGLAELDSAVGDFKSAFANRKLHVLYHDSLDNEETKRKTIQSQMAYEFGKKEAVAEAEHKKEMQNQQTLQEEKSRKQKVIITFVAFGLLLLLIFAAFVFRSLRVTRRQKDLINSQKELVEHQKKEVERQKNILEEKQKEIIDSITYARRIQRSLFPTELYLEKTLNRLKKQK